MVQVTMGESVSVTKHARFPAPSLTVFVLLQVLDIFTTWLGLQLGAQEGSVFLGRLMRVGPLAALLIGKIIAVLLVTMALRFKRPRVVVIVNYWLAAVVTWNLGIIFISQFSAAHRD
jgi:hypothetical protein